MHVAGRVLVAEEEEIDTAPILKWCELISIRGSRFAGCRWMSARW